MLNDLADRVQRIKPSPTLAVSAKADELIAAGKSIINLGVGEPDFDTPDYIKNAAIEAIKNGFTKYTAVDGTPSLKQAIINKFARENQLQYDKSQILVSCGAKHSLFNLFSAILNDGDEVLIPAPYWVSYPDIAKLVDATPVIIPSSAEQKFKITPAQLEKAITKKTRLMVFNSPSNPSGMAYTKHELAELGKVLLQHPQVMIVSDDIYEHTLWCNEPFANIVMACPELYDRTIVVNGVSKSHAMTGWRIGYAAGPKNIIAAMKKIQSQSTSNPCSISQVAAETGLNGDISNIKMMITAYKQRHDFLIQEFSTINDVSCQPCDGTFYLLVNIEKLLPKFKLQNDIEFSEHLLNQAGVAVIPGSAFGLDNYIRLSYATSMDKLKDAMVRFKKLLG